jgi:RHS repeat-associated protein
VRTSGNVVRYFGMDGVGSVSVLTEGSKPLVYFHYEPWGRALVRVMSGAEIPTDTVRPRWKGAFFEPVAGGLYYMRNRWYDLATGRFLSEDPIGLLASLNFYEFGAGEPINARDPRGQDVVTVEDECRQSPPGPMEVTVACPQTGVDPYRGVHLTGDAARAYYDAMTRGGISQAGVAGDRQSLPLADGKVRAPRGGRRWDGHRNTTSTDVCYGEREQVPSHLRES